MKCAIVLLLSSTGSSSKNNHHVANMQQAAGSQQPARRSHQLAFWSCHSYCHCRALTFVGMSKRPPPFEHKRSPFSANDNDAILAAFRATTTGKINDGTTLFDLTDWLTFVEIIRQDLTNFLHRIDEEALKLRARQLAAAKYRAMGENLPPPSHKPTLLRDEKYNTAAAKVSPMDVDATDDSSFQLPPSFGAVPDELLSSFFDGMSLGIEYHSDDEDSITPPDGMAARKQRKKKKAGGRGGKRGGRPGGGGKRGGGCGGE